MPEPIILSVDDDPQVLAAIGRDLRSRYGEHYRIMRAGSGAEALDTVDQLLGRGDSVALFLVDQRMPGMEGTDFLLEASTRFPDAKRVLLTAYADTDAAISAINEVGLDHYLMKPWDPPEDRLYPTIDEQLDNWVASRPAPFDGIRVAGTTWSPATHEVKEFLARSQVPYRFLDVDRDPDAQSMVTAAGDGAIPVVFVPGSDPLVQPDIHTLATSIGLHTETGGTFYDVVVVGGGPAGLAAAVYGASEGLRTALIERAAPGGQAGTSSRIENYLGFPSGISGGDLTRRAVTQAARLGAELVTAVEVTSIGLEDNIKVLSLSSGAQIRCHAVLIASGMTVRKLSVPGYERFEGRGVYYGAAPSEAATYAGGHVYIVGGANSAGQAAMMFSRHAAEVTMVVRATALTHRMSQYLVDQIGATENIEVLTGAKVIRVDGEQRVERIIVDTGGSDEEARSADAVFIFVGAVPHSAYVRDVVATSAKGFILTGRDLSVAADDPQRWPLERDPFPLETSVPGIFAAGDVRHGVVRRVASAVGQGSVAISMIHQYLETV